MNPEALLCENCADHRREIKARRLCARCYRLVRLREEIEAWNWSDRFTIKKLHANESWPDEDRFNKIKYGYIYQIDSRLDLLRRRIKQRQDGVSGLSIEMLLKQIARKAGVDPRKLWDSASVIDAELDPEQRRFVFCLLQDIEDAMPWEGLDLGKILQSN